MKFVFGIIVIILLAAQAPAAWDSYQSSQQCSNSMAKQLSSNLAKAHPDLDVVDCSFAHFYGDALKDLIGL
ncbi:MAG: hypothetical protein V7739_04160 [Motiliproteus sp.]